MALHKKGRSRLVRTGGALLALGVIATACATASVPAVEPTSESAAPAPVILHERYEVARGDTLSGIAWDHGVSVEELIAANPIDDPRKLEIGRVLRIPVAGSPTPSSDFDAGPGSVAEPDPTRNAEIAALVDQAQARLQREDYAGALEILTRAEEMGAQLSDDEASRNTRARVALMAAMVELGRGDDAGVVRRFAEVLGLLPHYVPEPGVFSPHALELLEQARSEVAFRP